MQDISFDVEDKNIVSKVIDGDIDAYEKIMSRYEAKLHRYVVYLIHNHTVADDVVQETFIKTYKSLRSFNSKYKFSSWIYRIAHNEAMNTVKKIRYSSGDDINELPDIEYNQQIEKLVDNKIIKGHINDCLAKIDTKYREIVQLVYLEGMKYEEVSDILHIPSSTVGVWLSRAKKKLKDVCSKKGVEL